MSHRFYESEKVVPCSVPLSEILVPIFASILLSVLHCHIAQTQAQE